MKNLRGTALYCGIGNDISQMKKHIEEAAKAGINSLFTSLQLPESDKTQLLKDFPIMAEIAHNNGISVEADISERTARLFGLDMKDIAAFHKMGVDHARLDFGFSDEEAVALSHNHHNVTIVLNAEFATDAWLTKLIDMGINKEQVCFCHNYYPMRYTGLTFEQAEKLNDTVHKYGFRVSGFLASQTHRRIACSIGLPTLERHRDMNVFTASQEAFLCGFDDLFFGDDFASFEEMKTLACADPEVVTIRMTPLVDGEIIDWLSSRVLEQTQCGLEMILRSNFMRSTFPGNADHTISAERKRGDVTVCKSSLWRYAGEIQLARKDLPLDPGMGLIGRIVDEDLPLLDTFRSSKKFRLVISEN